MNRSSSWALQQALKKKNQSQKKAVIKETYASLELRQGKADAEMLIEKNGLPDQTE